MIAGLDRASDLLAEATAILVTAGAGMGADSGLPVFRGTQGFWRAYPRAQELGLRFEELAQPRWFADDPYLAWGFYGHRLMMYRQAQPHEGYDILRRWSLRKPLHVVTSNVDGLFRQACFSDTKIYEVHGSIHHLQCSENCHDGIWSAPKTFEPSIDQATLRADVLPSCPRCGAVARPNILMFNDARWNPRRSDHQSELFDHWLGQLGTQMGQMGKQRLVIIEIGAGTAVATIRQIGESTLHHGPARYGLQSAHLIRINPEPEPESDHIQPLECSAAKALALLDQAVTIRW